MITGTAFSPIGIKTHLYPECMYIYFYFFTIIKKIIYKFIYTKRTSQIYTRYTSQFTHDIKESLNNSFLHFRTPLTLAAYGEEVDEKAIAQIFPNNPPTISSQR